ALTIIGILASLIPASERAWAQTPVTSSVKVGLSVENVLFYVDGRQYSTTQIFLWPEGSKHTVQFLLSVDVASGDDLPYQAGRNSTERYTFGGWKTNGPTLNPGSFVVQVITASPSISQIIGQVTVQYKMLIQFYGSAAGDGNCSGAPSDPAQDALR